MSEAFYNRMAATATRLIGKYGMTITITRDTGITRDRVTGVASGSSPQTLTPRGIVKEYSDKEIDGTRIKNGDRLVILDKSYTPNMSDKISLDGLSWNIISVTTVKPSSVSLVHFVQVRK